MPRLTEGHSTYRVIYDIGIAGSGMGRPGTARLRGEEPVRSRSQRLSRGQCILIGDGRSGAAAALLDLASHRVVLTTKADPTRSLKCDGDREGRDIGCIADPNHLFVEPWTARGDRGSDCHS